ncbi:MAG: nucleotidyltransferase family protein [Pseudomonadota bacterium]
MTEILAASPLIRDRLERARKLALPGWRIVAGAVYNTVWNHLTGRDAMYGLNDIDLAYFDPDVSYEAEDRAIRLASATFGAHPPVEVRNQARVHLWYEARFGARCAPISSVEDSLTRYLSRTQAVGVRLEPDGSLDIAAPFGLEALFAMRIEPNCGCPAPGGYAAKAARMQALWPELTIVPAGSGERL